MKSIGLLTTILLSIPTLKATPPLRDRVITSSPYSDVNITLIEKTDDSESVSGEGKKYKIHVKNTGTGYLDILTFGFPKDSEYRYKSYNIEFVAQRYSNQQVFGPNEEWDMIISANYDTNDINDFYVSTYAYTEFDNSLKISGTKNVYSEENPYKQGTYRNSIDASFDGIEPHSNNERYCYGAIVKATIEGEAKYFAVNYDFYFETEVEIDGDIEIVELVKTEYSDFGKIQMNNKMMGCLAFFIFGVPSIICVLFITAVVIVIVGVTRKRKQRQKINMS